ncbi:response regulator [Thalassobaculum sp. OXR-137]|uniref:response regulator n=1 Tax=Thalassobaculum sp. OXR-137 TaxID=3100173 RepID=UPI002AC9305E|nr:response regulator [Thalassobaculum sp. OXR-137]WPZ35002.1 response regulator [Thalassobaculum sp. OXR-137]
MSNEQAELRHHARVMLWDRDVGDELFRLATDQVTQGQTVVDNQRMDAFRRFYRAWRDGVSTVGAPLFTDAALFSALPGPDNVPRQILMLSDFAGFPIDQAAEIVGIDRDAAEKALAAGRAQNRVDPAMGCKALIIEDEFLIAEELSALCKRAGIAEVYLARTVDQALSAAQDHLPDIIFADFRLKDGETGVEAIEPLRDLTGAPVGFVTAYPHSVLKHSVIPPDFLIQKPFRPEAVTAIIGHWLVEKEMD